MQKKIKKVRVEVETKGKWAEVYTGTSLKVATGIKNMLRRQNAKMRPLIIIEH